MSLLNKIVLLVSVCSLMLSCTVSDSAELDYESSDITGTWIDSVDVQSVNPEIDFLVLSANGNFVYRNEYYTNGILNAYSERAGNFIISAKKIYFVSRQLTEWNANASLLTNSTQIVDEVIFKNCTYSLQRDTLILSYTDTSATASIVTKKFVQSYVYK